jgi:hypothetical protein
MLFSRADVCNNEKQNWCNSQKLKVKIKLNVLLKKTTQQKQGLPLGFHGP